MTRDPSRLIASKPLRVGLFGATGTGKSVAARRMLEAWKPARALVWDFKHDPTLAGVGKPCTDLAAVFRAMAAPRWCLRYLVNHDADIKDQFQRFCQAAYLAGDLVLFVDEVPEVSAPGRAPPAWKKIVNTGRQYTRKDGRVVGIAILAAGQRPAECDKSFIANLDVTRSGRLGYEDDARAMGNALGCDWRQLLALPDLAYIERTAGAVAPTHGTITFGKKKSQPAGAS